MAAKDNTPTPSSSSTEPGGPLVIDNESLHALQSDEARKLMSVVDSLRRGDLGSELHLPMLVVSGDQSSGKSSVLEAITEIPFPRKENMCTRFATQITLLRHPVTSVSAKIKPDKQRSSADKEALERFNRSIEDVTELPRLIEEATELMGLNYSGHGPVPAFSRDILSIEIAGPDRQPLTLVDLPGLIQTTTKTQSDQDIALIKSMVFEYIENPRAIIMAVVSAKTDYANQKILRYCTRVDPYGERTMGVITKPDELKPGTANEAWWLELAQNDNVRLQLGWHMLKNSSADGARTDFVDRNAEEAAFFQMGRYADLPQEIVGIKGLRTRLGETLFDHLRTALPVLREELDLKLDQVKCDLAKLGKKPEGTQEQREIVTQIGEKYRIIVRNAVNGHYEQDRFFESLDPDAPINGKNNIRRLRAVVQHLNEQFASTMRQHGRKSVVPSSKPHKRMAVEHDYARFAKHQKVATQDAAVESARRIILRSRGLELPGMFSPAIISELFRSQSESWTDIARFHVEQVAKACERFVKAAVDDITTPEVATRLLDITIDPALASRLDRAKGELDTIIADSKRHPITNNEGYLDTADQNQKDRKGITTPKRPFYQAPPAPVIELDNQPIDGAAELALDHEQAYYEDEVKIFIANVTRQVIERHLMQDLAEETVSPVLGGRMEDAEIAALLAEPRKTAQLRSRLESRKKTLEDGQKTLRQYGRL
ncbi:hypothetical protein LTR17_013349 [Elasticomyces elasticus]|nr:hypothetical protein LTR17_013349 [Elasticomyces elasticus]